jgi:polyphosphate kinase 2 (PPK2 family)
MKEQALIPPFGKTVDLSEYDPAYKADLDKDSTKKEIRKLRKRLREHQAMLYAQGEKSLLIVFQAMDAGGKDGTIRAVFQGVNPQGVRVTSFKKPTDIELAHDFFVAHSSTHSRQRIYRHFQSQSLRRCAGGAGE